MISLSDFKADFNQVIDSLNRDTLQLRTGRASTILVEDIKVEAYGVYQPLKAVASLSIPDPKTINIEPWDKGLFSAVEKAVRDSELGFNPVNDGRLIRVVLPDLTVERKKDLVKLLNQKAETARIALRKIRDDVKNLILAEEKNGEIGEDDRYRLQEDLDKMTKENSDKIKDIVEKKEKEINLV
ncbi:MAG: ribosome recycling factor [Patescibacteria group bacterium]|nr:ribosome recycling factor [Patescibacteria group bacterium]